MPNDTPEPGETPWFLKNQPNGESAPRAFEDADTAEIPTQLPSGPPPLPPQVQPEAKFGPLDPSELSERELRDFNMELTLHKERRRIDLEYHKLRREVDFEHEKRILTLKNDNKPPEPEEWRDGYNVWRMIFEMFIPASALAVLLFFIGAMITGTFVDGWWSGPEMKLWLWIGAAVFALLTLPCLWVMRRSYINWGKRVNFCNVNDTGVRMPGSKFYALDEINRKMSTSAIVVKDHHQGWFTKTFHINSHYLNLETNAQEDDALKKKYFVRNADQLVAAVVRAQEYRRQTRQ